MQLHGTQNICQHLGKIEKELITKRTFFRPFRVPGFCIPCNEAVFFRVEKSFKRKVLSDNWVPNWRESIRCPLCKMNNRKRLSATLLKQELENRAGLTVYFMEQITQIYSWAKSTFPNHNIIGSEYLGQDIASGSVIDGIRHEGHRKPKL